ncbi:MAG: hypothetical protein IKH50_00345 [Oscillospiraceae bacterium]|nr:hypothetical protein [Oscillospiraceae bacterium]
MDEKILSILTQIQTDVSTLKDDVSSLKEDMATVKESCEITRTAVNSLIEWTECASVVLGIPYPVN